MKNRPFLNFVRKVLPFVAPRVAQVVEVVDDIKAARVEEVPPAAPTPPVPQALQGGVTYMGLAVAALSYVLQHWELVPPGYDSTATATVLIGVALAAYGRVRREWRG